MRYAAPVARVFNTTGPCDPERHYMVPPLPRLPDARRIVEQGGYFVVHAPRQVGKTTTLKALAETLTAEGAWAALLFSCETAEPAQDDFGAAERIVLASIRATAERCLPPELRPPPFANGEPGRQLHGFLTAWATSCPRPLVLFFDEIDALRGESLRAILRQLRDGFPARPRAFPHAVALCGLRDVRDYRAAAGADPDRLGTSSPFNVKVESLRVADFSDDETRALLGQHESETGQRFDPDAVASLTNLTCGQPWLVNALAREIVEKLRPEGTILATYVDAARERLVTARQTHLDSLAARLREDRVRRVLSPLLAGEVRAFDAFDDDLSYVRDLGLIAADDPVRMANPIYAEVVPRALSHGVRSTVWLMDAVSSCSERLGSKANARSLRYGGGVIGSSRGFSSSFGSSSGVWSR